MKRAENIVKKMEIFVVFVSTIKSAKNVLIGSINDCNIIILVVKSN